MHKTTDPSCHIDPSVQLSTGVDIGYHVTIMADASVGEGSRIGHNVVIYPGTKIGREVTIYDNTVIGRQPQSAGNLARPLKSDLAPIQIGSYSVIGACAVLYAGTTIGEHVLVSDLCSVREECVIEDFVVLGRGVILNYDVHVGKKTRIMDQSHITGKCRIGEDCFISVLVGTTNENNMLLGKELIIEGPTIGDRARLGVGVNVLPGKSIGKDSIVSAASLVSTDIPEGVLAAGVPARVIRDNPFLNRKSR
jgi:UDP-3-O-[3-hydroxymyristoyl] glucosamine N-acyltransferase